MVASAVSRANCEKTIHSPVVSRRILMTADPVGGVWTYALELAHGLSGYGVEVGLATMGRSLSPEQRCEVRNIRNITLYESTFRLEWMEDPWEDVERSGEWLLGLEKEFRPDLVHLNGYMHATLPWKCPCLVVAHSCVLSWWDAVRKDELPANFAQYRERVALGLAAADLIVAPTQAMLGSLETFYLPLRNSRVINNSRSSSIFIPGKKSDLIFSVGRLWDAAKNIGAVAKSACSLTWPVCVAGEEKHPEGGAVSIRNISRLGYLPPQRLASWFAIASVYAHPARYEPFGLTVLEAAMSRCALVLGDIPSLRELWQDAALFVQPDDNAALTRQLFAFCNDRAYREEMAEKAFNRSRSFTTQRMAGEYLDAYDSLVPGMGNCV